MGSIWTVDPAVRRIDLLYRGTAFWIDVKQELSAGEARRIEASGIRSYSQPAGAAALDAAGDALAQQMEINVSLELAMFEKVRTWLAGWSLTDDKGSPLQHQNIDTLRALRDDLFRAIDTAIEKHAREVRDAQKKLGEAAPMAASQSAPART